MSWEQRLRGIVLAGGAMAAMGCSSNSGTPSADAGFMFPCCNGSSDPCCPYYCYGAPMTQACAEKPDGAVVREAGPGVAADSSVPQEGGPTGDSSEAASNPIDASSTDAVQNAADAPSDAVTYDVFPHEAGPSDAAADGDAHD